VATASFATGFFSPTGIFNLLFCVWAQETKARAINSVENRAFIVENILVIYINAVPAAMVLNSC
jgi:hypothetical protein